MTIITNMTYEEFTAIADEKFFPTLDYLYNASTYITHGTNGFGKITRTLYTNKDGVLAEIVYR